LALPFCDDDDEPKRLWEDAGRKDPMELWLELAPDEERRLPRLGGGRISTMEESAVASPSWDLDWEPPRLRALNLSSRASFWLWLCAGDLPSSNQSSSKGRDDAAEA